MADTPSDPYTPPQVENRSSRPPGVLPRNAQTWVLGTVALLMVVVIALSGGPPKERATSTLAPGAAVVDPNASRIQEYRARIEEQARKLAWEQAQLARSRETPAPVSGDQERPPAGMPYGGPAGYSAYPAADSALSAERQKRAYESLFASNIALSYRSVGRPTEQPKTSLLSVGGSPAVPSRSDDSTARLAAPQASRPSPMDVAAQETSSEQVDHAPEKPRHQFSTELNWADGKAYRVFEGSVIETVLTNRLDGTFSGPVNCMVTTPVHSHDGRKVLIPRGSRVLGEVRKVDAWGQQRLAVVFHRLIMPDGYSLDLDRFQGLNQVGETGLVDQINRHYLQIFGVSLAIGAIAGLSQANTRYGPETTAADVYRQGVADSLSQSSLRILDRYLNVLPTFTIREGHRLKVAITQDLSLPAYNQHRLPSDL